MSVSTRTLIVVVVLVAVGRGQSGLELFKNPGFEDSDIESVYGHAWGYKAERVTDSHSGSYAVKLSGRYVTLGFCYETARKFDLS